MDKKNYIIIALIIISVIGGYFVYQMISPTPISEIQLDQQTQPVESIEETVSGYERITLSSNNWEAFGSTIIIEKDGKYTIEFGSPGLMETREGNLNADELSEMINNANLFSMNDEYTGPKNTTRSWMQYHLNIETKTGSKSVRFHSEDETAPQVLHNLVNKITQLTN